MYETKVNLTMVLPGRIMMSERECLRKTRKPLMGKGKKSNKQVIDKNGNPVWVTVKELDPSKCDRNFIEITDQNGEIQKLQVLVPGNKPASKSMSLGMDSYRYFISSELPEGFRAPKTYKPKVSPFRIPVNLQAWKEMSEAERLEWHLRDICHSQGGILVSYNVNDA